MVEWRTDELVPSLIMGRAYEDRLETEAPIDAYKGMIAAITQTGCVALVKDGWEWEPWGANNRMLRSVRLIDQREIGYVAIRDYDELDDEGEPYTHYETLYEPLAVPYYEVRNVLPGAEVEVAMLGMPYAAHS